MITVEITRRCFRRDGTDGEGRVRIALNPGYFETYEVIQDFTDCGVFPVEHRTLGKSGLARTLEVATQFLADELTDGVAGEQQFLSSSAAMSSPDGKKPGTVSVEQAAVRLGVGRTTLYAMIKRGEIPALKFGRARRISESTLDHMIAEGVLTPRNAAAKAVMPVTLKRPGRR